MQVKESKTNWHFRISLVKSLLRIAAGILLSTQHFGGAGVTFIIAEALGIVEEL